jgi:hypothetical protein
LFNKYLSSIESHSGAPILYVLSALNLGFIDEFWWSVWQCFLCSQVELS